MVLTDWLILIIELIDWFILIMELTDWLIMVWEGWILLIMEVDDIILEVLGEIVDDESVSRMIKVFSNYYWSKKTKIISNFNS